MTDHEVLELVLTILALEPIIIVSKKHNILFYERCLEILVQGKNHKHIRNSKSLTIENRGNYHLDIPNNEKI